MSLYTIYELQMASILPFVSADWSLPLQLIFSSAIECIMADLSCDTMQISNTWETTCCTTLKYERIVMEQMPI